MAFCLATDDLRQRPFVADGQQALYTHPSWPEQDEGLTTDSHPLPTRIGDPAAGYR